MSEPAPAAPTTDPGGQAPAAPAAAPEPAAPAAPFPPAPEATPATPAAPAAPPDWKAAIGDESLRTHPVVGRFETVEALAREHVNVQSLIGADKVPKPPADPQQWNAEQWNAHYRALGRPDEPKGYGIDPEKLPEGLEAPESYEHDPERAKARLDELHAAGLTPRQADRVYRSELQREIEQSQAAEARLVEARNETVETLQKEWGSAYGEKVRAGWDALVQLTGDDQIATSLTTTILADGSALGANQQFVRLMAEIGERVREDRTPDGGKSTRIHLTPEEADRRIQEYRFQQRDALLNTAHPGHKAAHDHLESLYAQKHGGS